mmetsp:Transcript_32878/g.55482  ORF Transcript_32878/g.55482 Transcript_32878/m.55482 type:complete len:343 (-) Transcript_32878:217-1245(-)
MYSSAPHVLLADKDRTLASNPIVTTTTPSVSLTPLQTVLSSSSGAFLTCFLINPFDVVKTRMQTQASTSYQIAAGSDFRLRYTSNTDAVFKIVRYEGLLTLWKGLGATLVHVVPGSALYYAGYEYLKTRLQQHSDSSVAFAAPALAGIGSRATVVTLLAPLDMVRTNIQAQIDVKGAFGQHFRGITDGFRQVIAPQGGAMRLAGCWNLYRGLGPTLLRDVPFSAIYWATYETLQRRWKRGPPGGPIAQSFGVSFAAGASAGTLAAFITMPFDVVKTRIQVQLRQNEPDRTWTVLKSIYRTEGFKALFVGLIPRLAKIAPACAVTISTFEVLKSLFLREAQTA